MPRTVWLKPPIAAHSSRNVGLRQIGLRHNNATFRGATSERENNLGDPRWAGEWPSRPPSLNPRRDDDHSYKGDLSCSPKPQSRSVLPP
jgi:hypothetical protein